MKHLHLRSFLLGATAAVAVVIAFGTTRSVVLAQAAASLNRNTCQKLDINGDDQINITDYSQMVRHFFQKCSVIADSGATPTPAPTAAPTATPRPGATPTPAATPAPTPGTPTAVDPSGESMPEGDLAGWKQIYKENFSRNVAAGGTYNNQRSNSFISVYSNTFVRTYADGEPDTAGKNEGKPSRYWPSKVLSVKDGVLIKNVHTETVNGKSVPMAAGLFAKVNPSDSEGARTYGKYTVRFRVYKNNAASLKGFKMAWLLWPKSQNWPKDGEIDFPEGDFNGTIFAAHHRQEGTSGDDQDVFFSSTKFLDGNWHTASMEWLPNRMTFILDGVKLGEVTKRIPNTPMFWVMQTESCFQGPCPDPAANGNVEIDWMTAYSPN